MDHLHQEEQLISVLLQDKEYVRKWTQTGIGHDRFDKSHEYILSGIQFAFNNDVSLTRESFKNFLTNYKKLTPAETAAQVSLYSRCLMKATKKDDFPMLLETVKQSFIRRKTSQFLQEYNRDRERLGDIGANRSLIEKMQSLEAESIETKSIFIGAHEIKDSFMTKLMDRRLNPHVRLECGIKEIDDTMNVGFKDGHLTIFCAPIGGGKTTMMTNVAANLYSRYNTNVMYIPLEMPNDEIFTKLVSRETGISLKKIEHAETLTEEEIKMLSDSMDKWKNIEHKFNVLDLPERAKVSTIRREIEKRINYFKPKVIFIDYADNLVPDQKRSRSDEEMNDMLQDIRKMGKALGFHTCSAAQLAKDFLKQFSEQKEGKQSAADSTSIRGGLVYTMNADSVYAQLRDPAMPNEKLIFMCIKSRHGSPVFGPQGNIKTHLSFRPDIALIESANDIVYEGPKDSDLLDLVGKMPSPEDVAAAIDEGSPF